MSRPSVSLGDSIGSDRDRERREQSRLVRSVRLWPDHDGPPEGGHYAHTENAL